MKTNSNKKLNLYYWIFTLLFAAFMLFTSIPDVIGSADALDFIHNKLGYPSFFARFIGIAKVLGVIAIVIPGFPKIKEWAYAGFAFDLIGAVYSIIAVFPPSGGWAFMLVPMGLGTLSYIFFHKRLSSASGDVVGHNESILGAAA